MTLRTLPKPSLDTLRARLIALILLIWLPALMLTVWSASEQARIVSANAQAEALRLSQLAASYQEQVVRGTELLLSAIGQLPDIHNANSDFCRPLFARLVEQYDSYTNLFLVDTDGNTYCSGLGNDPTPEQVMSRVWFQQAMESGSFSEGNYAIGIVSRRPVITYAYPIREAQDSFNYIIAASVDLGWVGEFIAEANLPNGVMIAAIDRSGTILYHYPPNESAVGTPWPDTSVVDLVFTRQTGTFEARGLDGSNYLFGFSPLVSTGGTYVMVAIPSAQVLADINSNLIRHVIGLAIVGLVTLALVAYGTNTWLLRPINSLVTAARRLAGGDLAARANGVSGAAELRQLAQGFNDMAATLQANDETLQRAYSHLDDQVQQRTAELARSEARLRLIADSLPVLISYIDSDLRYQFANRTYETWYGLSPEALAGKTLGEVLGQEVLVRLKPHIDRVLSGDAFQFEDLMPYKTGGTRSVEIVYVPNFDAGGSVRGFYAMVMDVTERKRDEERKAALLRVTQAFSEAMTMKDVGHVLIHQGLASLKVRNTGMYLVDYANGVLKLVSLYFAEMPVQPPYGDIPLDADMATARVAREAEPLWFGDPDIYRAAYPRFADEFVTTGNRALCALPLVVNGRVVGALTLGFAEDQTFDADDQAFIMGIAQQCAQALERARLYEAEADARKQAEEANTLKTRFLGMVSHELRTPLTPIKGMLSTLLATDVDWTQEQQRDFLAIADEETDKLTNLVEQLLDLSRLQGGSLSITTQPERVADIVGTAQTSVGFLTARHQLKIDLPPDLPPVMADRQRIAQVLINLTSNAAKYAPDNSQITFRARQAGDMVEIAVQDRGPGIPPEEHTLVFEAFRQLRRKNGTARGAGLGLAICKGLVEAHGGHIWIDGTYTEGTRVVFTLPVA